ncbi:MAG TPA: riboflavin synthase [Ferruginibacter sp.]|nr:riboflavin synthase [Ferruginibacter sp.]
MFTGIIETTGFIHKIILSGTNRTFCVKSPISQELKVDQSVSHNGVCLTVEAINDGMHQLTAIEETLAKTNLGDWQEGDTVNIERCLQMNGRLDGHIVQGHVDTTGTCTVAIEKNGSWEYSFEIDKKFASLIIEKGSISLNGISLTIFNVKEDGFTVAIIPYTYTHTNMQFLKAGDKVNIEFDMIGKYVNRMESLKK